MNKKELIEKLYIQIGNGSKIETERILNTLIKIIKDNLKNGHKVSIASFGTFSIKIRKARKGVNPQTGKRIKIPAMKVVKFTVGSALKRAVK
ncbi:HU family DNA-binding protein [Patescibacteria group bacterium]|nr:HU family DNA-binding protein [Patescibacteria group bacterium]